ncbi:hypothetical protein [uncultured Microbacterium sp.]|uniref:hypothetical protein n=1 Tax=uncultured Microbacterium sp. TaxID=191216 RepID=UPI0025E23A3B|nr:hypothetical protein [uncultured Microbacterium sp.]
MTLPKLLVRFFARSSGYPRTRVSCSTGSLPSLGWHRPGGRGGVTATSKDPRIATENFSTPAVAAIVSRTGRDLGQFSAHPAEQKIVLPPAVVLLEVARTFLPDGRPVVIIEQLAEQDPSASLPPTLDALVDHVRQRLQSGLKAREAPITTRGKLVEQFFFLDEE